MFSLLFLWQRTVQQQKDKIFCQRAEKFQCASSVTKRLPVKSDNYAKYKWNDSSWSQISCELPCSTVQMDFHQSMIPSDSKYGDKSPPNIKEDMFWDKQPMSVLPDPTDWGWTLHIVAQGQIRPKWKHGCLGSKSTTRGGQYSNRLLRTELCNGMARIKIHQSQQSQLTIVQHTCMMMHLTAVLNVLMKNSF